MPSEMTMDGSCSTGRGNTCNLVGAVREPPLQCHDYGYQNRRHGFVVMSNQLPRHHKNKQTARWRPVVALQIGGPVRNVVARGQIEIDPIVNNRPY